MTETPMLGVSHIGICVSDLERSARFYTEALGFELEQAFEFGAPFDVLAELPGLKARAAFYRHGRARIELIYNETPAPVGSSERRPMNQLGLTHIAVSVSDLDAAVARVEQYGGRAYPETTVRTPSGDLIFCTDPDGVRIELWRKPA